MFNFTLTRKCLEYRPEISNKGTNKISCLFIRTWEKPTVDKGEYYCRFDVIIYVRPERIHFFLNKRLSSCYVRNKKGWLNAADIRGTHNWGSLIFISTVCISPTKKNVLNLADTFHIFVYGQNIFLFITLWLFFLALMFQILD